MKDPLKPRDKITQHMTRDGLVRENQTTGEVQSVSGRDAAQNLSPAALAVHTAMQNAVIS